MEPRTIGSLVELVRGNTYKSALLDQDGPYLLGLASIERNGGFRTDKLRTYGGPSAEKHLVYPGDMYVSLKDLTQSAYLLGSIARVPENIALGRMTQDTVKLQFTDNEYPQDFFYWVLRTPQYKAYCKNRAIGTTNLSLSREDFLSFTLPAVTNTRSEIVKLLERIEDKLEINRQINQTLEQMAQAMFKSWFVDFDPVKAKMNGEQPKGMDAATASLFPEKLVESELGLIPEGWEPKQLKEVLELAYGKALKKTDRVAGDVPVYGSGGLTGYHNQSLIEGPGIIVGRKGTVGSVYWEPKAFYPIDTVFYVKPKTGYSLKYCHLVLQNLGLKDMNTDAAVPGLNRNNAYRLDVITPSEPVLKKFEEMMQSFQSKVDTNNAQNASLESLRDTLLPKLLSGEIDLENVQVKEVKAIVE
ncbi:restriction endonuclease subunit S [Vibrio kanaloae]|uniref:restriction endonuclease subunit S n=1 Tax=Vibrio kanaloae TaxID=170673 RepID=UPI0010BF25EE|nr:restriction endonuclease subunit S [Vibrio kanaloae]TKE90420.1 restriction endonuclease subunit S [Vibrio kanaloae]TKF12538.1 restriction endonuclease subunit S [Vibrio kanaloae]